MMCLTYDGARGSWGGCATPNRPHATLKIAGCRSPAPVGPGRLHLPNNVTQVCKGALYPAQPTLHLRVCWRLALGLLGPLQRGEGEGAW